MVVVIVVEGCELVVWMREGRWEVGGGRWWEVGGGRWEMILLKVRACIVEVSLQSC